MKLIKKNISITKLNIMAKEIFGDLVKAVVDVEKEIMAVSSELHSDEETLLLKDGSRQNDLWGINLYPKIKDDSWIEFDSMINIRPSSGNCSRGVNNPKIRNKIIKVVNKLVQK